MVRRFRVDFSPKARTRLRLWRGQKPTRAHSTTTESSPKQPKEWKSWKLKRIALLPLFAITLGLIGSIVTLVVLSYVRHGFVAVENTSQTFALISWKISLTWTFVPSIIFQIYGLGVVAIIDGFGFRQPFIELARGATANEATARGARARKSIALDYGSYFPIQR